MEAECKSTQMDAVPFVPNKCFRRPLSNETGSCTSCGIHPSIRFLEAARSRPILVLCSLQPASSSSQTSTTSINGITITHSHDEMDQSVSNQNKIVTSLLAGALAGALAKTTIAPLDRAKINFQISNTPFTVRRLWRFLEETVRSQGMRHLWRGNSATMARIVPYASIQFASHEQYKRLLGLANGRSRHDENTLSMSLRHVVAGSLAGLSAVSSTYPLDLARARMAVTERARYTNLRAVFARIVRDEGVHSLYRGFQATVLGVVPYSGVSFATYEMLKRLKRRYDRREPTTWERLCYGAMAGALGQTSSYPLDVIRRRMQTSGCTEKNGALVGRSVWGMLVYIARTEGVIGGLYKGLSVNWIKGPIAAGVSFCTFDTVQRALRLLPRFRDEQRASAFPSVPATSSANSSSASASAAAPASQRRL